MDLERKQATVTLEKEVEDAVLMDAITQAGYTPTGCIQAWKTYKTRA